MPHATVQQLIKSFKSFQKAKKNMVLNGYMTSCSWILDNLVIWSLSEGSGPSSHGPRWECWTALLFKVFSAPPWTGLYPPNHGLQGWPYVFWYPLSCGKWHNSALLHLRVIMWLALASEMPVNMMCVVFELLLIESQLVIQYLSLSPLPRNRPCSGKRQFRLPGS